MSFTRTPVTEYNPWKEALTLLLTSKAIIHMTIRKDVWDFRETTGVTTMGDELIHALDQIGYNHRIEHYAPSRNPIVTEERLIESTSRKVIFQSEVTAKEKLIITVVADSEKVLIESGIDFADSLKDL